MWHQLPKQPLALDPCPYSFCLSLSRSPVLVLWFLGARGACTFARCLRADVCVCVCVKRKMRLRGYLSWLAMMLLLKVRELLLSELPPDSSTDYLAH